MTLQFETETCSRCHGSGEYSYCESYGRTCFKCAGKRVQLTARAKVAAAWEASQKQRKMSEVKVGERVRVNGVGTFRVTMSEASTTTGKSLQPDGSWKENAYWEIGSATPGLGLIASPEYEVQVIGEKADAIALRQKAIEYQNSLTKAGKPAKRKVEA